MLTTLQIKAAKPSERPYKLADTGGLYVLINPNGSKLWRYKFRLSGVEGVQALGAFPSVGLVEARAAHAISRQLVRQGLHPVRSAKARATADRNSSEQLKKSVFENVASAWLSATAPGLSGTTAKHRQREIERYLTPKLEGRPLAAITRLEMTELVKSVEVSGLKTAANVRSHLYAIFEHAIDSGLIKDNPVPPSRILTKRATTHHAALTPERLGAFLQQLLASRTISVHSRDAMLLMLMTAARKGEVVQAKWAEFDLAKGEWEVPAERMKSRRPHWVPLSKQALDLLKRARSVAPLHREHVFPNKVDPRRPMSAVALNNLMKHMGFGDGTPHGMRACFSTYCNRMGLSSDAIERCLAHLPQDKVRAAYNRHDYSAERRNILQAWSDHLDAISGHGAATQTRGIRWSRRAW